MLKGAGHVGQPRVGYSALLYLMVRDHFLGLKFVVVVIVSMLRGDNIWILFMRLQMLLMLSQGYSWTFVKKCIELF